MTQRRRPLRLLAAIAVVGVVLAATLIGRHAILRATGRALVEDDPITPADAIVIAIDAGNPGVLEAADLVHHGIAGRVAVFADPPTSVDLEFSRRGIPYEDVATREIQLLRALGVPTIERIPRAVAGTEEEGSVLPEWCDQHRLGSIVVVSNADHTRRIGRVLRRAMKGRPVRVLVRASRYSEFDPDTWWQSRGSTRIGIVELQKLLVDIVRHPFS